MFKFLLWFGFLYLHVIVEFLLSFFWLVLLLPWLRFPFRPFWHPQIL